jgi:hypothetical protein
MLVRKSFILVSLKRFPVRVAVLDGIDEWLEGMNNISSGSHWTF